MITDANELTRGSTISATVAVVGAGPAGIITALELGDAGFDVLLIESGREGLDQRTQRLGDAIVRDPDHHAPMSMTTRRQIGGTSSIWGGRCVPFDPIDFEPRPMVDGIWPVGYEELAGLFQRTCDWFVCGRAAFDSEHMPQLPPSIVPGLEDGEMRTSSFERWSLPTNFGREYQERLRRSSRVRVVQGLTCLQVVCADGVRRVSHLDTRNLGGAEIRVEAQRYVLACGGLDTTRLLLASPGPDGVAIGDHSGQLGRWYMAHVEGSIARVRFNTPPSQTVYDYERDTDGVYVRRRFSIAAEAQRQHGLPNIVAWISNPELPDPCHGSGVLSLAYLLLASPLGPLLSPPAQRSVMTGKRVPGVPYGAVQPGPVHRHLANILREPIVTARWAVDFGVGRFLRRGRRTPGFFVPNKANTYPLQFHGEHLPLADSRVSLSSQCDEFGMPRLDIDVRFSDADVDGVIKAHELWDRCLQEQGRGRLEYKYEHAALAEIVKGQLGGGFHQAGTTRMSAKPDAGVLNSDLAVHGFDDLYVVSGSAFVTSSQANTTFTIGVFAVRLADRLKAELRRL